MSESAADRRERAIKDLFERFLPASNSYNLTTDDRELLAREVRENLLPLGKTERWTRAVEAWAGQVEDTSNDLHWAFVQYAVFTGHAAR